MFKDKITTAEKLGEIKENYLSRLGSYDYTVYVCGGGGCISSHCEEIENALRDEIEQKGITKSINILQTGCMGICAAGPMVLVEPGRIFYTKLTPEKTRDIVNRHLKDGEVAEEYTFFDESLRRHVPVIDDIEFFKAQQKLVLDNCGSIEHSDIKAYIARDGYLAAQQALSGKSPKEVIDEVKRAGRRGLSHRGKAAKRV